MSDDKFNRPEVVRLLEVAASALADAYNHLSPQDDPVLCVADGMVQTAMNAVDATLDLVNP